MNHRHGLKIVRPIAMSLFVLAPLAQMAAADASQTCPSIVFDQPTPETKGYGESLNGYEDAKHEALLNMTPPCNSCQHGACTKEAYFGTDPDEEDIEWGTFGDTTWFEFAGGEGSTYSQYCDC